MQNRAASNASGRCGDDATTATEATMRTQTVPVNMFETDEAFNDLDAIAATDGIDALTLGPTDLAQNLGVFGKPEMNKVLDERRDLILAAAKKHGKTCAMLVGSQEQAQQWKEAGVLLLVYKSEVEILASGFRDAMKAIRG